MVGQPRYTVFEKGMMMIKVDRNMLETLSVKELRALIHLAEEVKSMKMRSELRNLRDQFEAMAAEIGVSAKDILETAAPEKRPKADKQARRAVKYRGPNGEEWMGLGRRPVWLMRLEEQGKDKSEFLVS
jgi:DNA-binding protein H-NS